MSVNIKNIIIFRTDRLGEVLLSTVCVDVLKKNFLDASISFVTSEYSRPLLEDRKDLKEIFIFDTIDKRPGIVDAFRLARQLRRGKYDLAVVLNPHKMLHLACFLAGIPLRLGYNRKWAFFLNRKIADNRNEGEKHEIEYTMDLLRVLDIDQTPEELSLPVGKDAESRLVEILKNEKLNFDRPLVVIHPGSSNPAKVWPKENYAELIRELSGSIDC
ncbi:MAG: glycosyltransferase family 9 protein, partial [Candidatus Omnitrophica bacterium]|nr:glycosyltransferase family 9 protein [Candidatus Omnitrophota bacterium]